MILHATDPLPLFIHPASGVILRREAPLSNGSIPFYHENANGLNLESRSELIDVQHMVAREFARLARAGGVDYANQQLDFHEAPIRPETKQQEWVVADAEFPPLGIPGSWIVHTHRPIFCQFVPDETETTPPPPIVATGHYLPDDSPLRQEALAEYIRMTPIE
jgi:hypothetical protein